MNAPRVDRWGDPIEDDDNPPDTTTRTRDEIHSARIADLRRILAESRERRESDQ